MSFSFSELLSYYGGVLGLTLSIILLTKAKGNLSTRIILAAYLIIGSLIIILGALGYSGKILFLPHLLRVDNPLHYLFLPIGFFFVYSEFKPDFKWKSIYLLVFIPFLFDLALFVPFYTKDAAYKVNYYETYIAKTGSIIIPVQYLLKSLMLLISFLLQIYVFVKYKPKVNDRPKVIWFWIFLAGEGITSVGLVLDHLTGLHWFTDPYRFSINMVTLYIYDIALALMFFPSMLYGNVDQPEVLAAKEKYERSTLTTDEKAAILVNLLGYIENKEKPYLNHKITLHEVSVLLDISPNNLSQVINEKTGLNFNDYINSYRVKEAKLILSSPEFQKLTIDAIAKNAGFNSRTPFYNAFKKHAAMTPKEYVALHGLRSKLMPPL
jgi:AraC-like DNA-binding protein